MEDDLGRANNLFRIDDTGESPAKASNFDS